MNYRVIEKPGKESMLEFKIENLKKSVLNRDARKFIY